MSSTPTSASAAPNRSGAWLTHAATKSPPLLPPMIVTFEGETYFSSTRYLVAHWKSSKTFCLREWLEWLKKKYGFGQNLTFTAYWQRYDCACWPWMTKKTPDRNIPSGQMPIFSIFTASPDVRNRKNSTIMCHKSHEWRRKEGGNADWESTLLFFVDRVRILSLWLVTIVIATDIHIHTEGRVPSHPAWSLCGEW